VTFSAFRDAVERRQHGSGWSAVSHCQWERQSRSGVYLCEQPQPNHDHDCFQSESVVVRPAGDVHGDDQRAKRRCEGPSDAPGTSSEGAGYHRNGDVEREYRMRHNRGDLGHYGVATCTTTTLAVGTDAITAAYSGDSNNSASTATLSGGQVVNPLSQASPSLKTPQPAPSTTAASPWRPPAAQAAIREHCGFGRLQWQRRGHRKHHHDQRHWNLYGNGEPDGQQQLFGGFGAESTNATPLSQSITFPTPAPPTSKIGTASR